MPTTEIFTLPLAGGSDIGDPSNQAAAVSKESFETLLKSGAKKIYFGTLKEKPDVVQALIVWDSLQAHKDFEAQDSYKPFAQKFLSLAGGKPTIVHADFQAHSALETAVAAPVTEVATFVFEGAVPDGYAEGLEAFRAAAEKEAASTGYKGASFGFTVEEVEIDGVKGPAAVLAIGWESIDAHLKYRETQTFKDNIHHLRTGVKASSIHHVQFLNFVD